MKVLMEPFEFEWNTGNTGKNFARHNVTDGECEEVFFDPKKKLLKDILHSGKEKRYILLGMTTTGRVLFVIFTIRKGRIRIISARDLNRKEPNLYEERN